MSVKYYCIYVTDVEVLISYLILNYLIKIVLLWFPPIANDLQMKGCTE